MRRSHVDAFAIEVARERITSEGSFEVICRYHMREAVADKACGTCVTETSFVIRRVDRETLRRAACPQFELPNGSQDGAA